MEIKHTGKSMEQRLADRTKNSGDVKHADHVVKGDKDMITNIHHSRVTRYGEVNPGEGSITGEKRGPAAPLIGQLGEKQ
jgi:hypothetical protein